MMKAAGYILITVSFLVGAYFAVAPPAPLPVEGADAQRVPWTLVVPMLLLGGVGVALARFGIRQESQHEGALTANIEGLTSSIERIVENIRRLDGEKDGARLTSYVARLLEGRTETEAREALLAGRSYDQLEKEFARAWDQLGVAVRFR